MKKVSISVDAMGGDNAPEAVVDGCVQAVLEDPDIRVVLCGDSESIQAALDRNTYPQEQVVVLHTTEVIEVDEPPVNAIRTKKDSSLVKGIRLVREKRTDAFVSAGSTGAILAGGTLILGRIKGIERPALGSFIPNSVGFTLLLDCGANVDSKPEYLYQFAKMGSIYYKTFMNKENPSVGLVNIGEEESKGNQLSKEAYKLLAGDTGLNFIGNIEGREIPAGAADVVVCDGFVGNVILKYTEGFATSLFGMLKETFLSNMKSKMGALLLKGSMKEMLTKFDYTEYGGAPLLGLEGLVVKAHGSSDAKAFKNAILQCKKFSQEQVNAQIKENLDIVEKE
ncbi:phosphate acyltransferase PlsX [Anaerotalea alkaliphila]|uniref:Phosphate acyltransferase n=1 Tax=Anaerotalea alkaliphila TaxID=2662126 RepID=A0A7X5HUH8_9FIRM|nr:phosphate acyltransferase PlsX [Anaerotalea alkaliphila]NDL66870.1 phosphate acyltransferase PlsX [Anaerotalea alkaliphila]